MKFDLANQYYDNFNQGGSTDWTLYEENGGDMSVHHIWEEDYCLRMTSDTSSEAAHGRSPGLEDYNGNGFEHNKPYRLACSFKLLEPSHWIYVMSDQWVHLVIDQNNILKAYDGNDFVGNVELNYGEWYNIAAYVYPDDARYFVYVDHEFVGMQDFRSDNYRGKVLIGDPYDDMNYGKAQWNFFGIKPLEAEMEVVFEGENNEVFESVTLDYRYDNRGGVYGDPLGFPAVTYHISDVNYDGESGDGCFGYNIHVVEGTVKIVSVDCVIPSEWNSQSS